MTDDTYRTLSGTAEGEFTEKRSKFLAFALPVSHTDDVREAVKQYQQKYYDARHVCYAYKLGTDQPETRANDNGEPSGTAGKPILGQIQAFDLTNVLVIVVRYFGGVKLGTGGLVQAYKAAAQEALSRADIEERFIHEVVSFRFEYPLLNSVMRVVKELNPDIVQQDFDMQCSMTLSIRRSQFSQLVSKLEHIEGVAIDKADEA